jgi:PAS domain S-box-containing protein
MNMESSLVLQLAKRFMNMHASPCGLFNEQGESIASNDAMSEIFNLVGFSANEPKHADALEIRSVNFQKVLLWEEILERAEVGDFSLGVCLGVWAEHFFKCSVVKLHAEKSSYILLLLADITPEKALEKKLAQRNSILEKVINEFPEMIVALDDEGIIKVWNQRCVEVMGYPASLMIGSHRAMYRLFDRHDKVGEVLAKWNDRVENTMRSWEMEVLCNDGTIRHISWTVRYRDNPIVEGLHHWAIGVDITKQKVAEEAHRRSEERFDLICRTTNDAIWDWDLEKDILWWSDGMTKIFGHETREIENNIDWWVSNLHPVQRERVYACIKDSIDNGLPFWMDEYLFRKKDGNYTLVLDRGYLVKNPQGKPVRMTGGMVEQTKDRILEILAAETNAEVKWHLETIVSRM